MVTRLFRLVAASVALLLVPVTASADYGSGNLGDWSKYSRGVTGDAATANVWIVGDSITGRCWPRLKTRLAAKGQTLAVDYWSGSPTSRAVDVVLKRIASGEKLPSKLLLAAGANDIFAPPAIAGQIARLKAALPETTRLYWVDVSVSRWGRSYSTAMQVSDMRNSSWVNSLIRAQLPDGQVVAWSAQVAAIPGRGIAISRYLQDGVHPWPSAIDGHSDGCDLWAFTIVNKIGAAT